MKSILITGQYNKFVQLLIERFNKEGWRVSTLSKDKNAPPGVFHHYITNYEMEKLQSILESCKPNTLIFTGAYDGEFFNEKVRHSQQQRYISYLSALLLVANLYHVRRFINISSEAVYDDSFATAIFEDMRPNASTTIGSLLYMGEVLAREYAEHTAMDVVTLRLVNLYTVPASMNDCQSIITSKCLQAVEMRPVQICSKYAYNVLHGRDAAEAIYNIVSAPAHRYPLYHVASPVVLQDKDVVNAIESNASRSVEIEDKTTGLETQRILNADRFMQEFQFYPRVNIDTAVQEIMQNIRRNMRSFSSDGAGGKSSLLRKILQNAVAICEVLIAVVLCYIFTQILHKNPQFSEINLYLLCSLLFSTFYGTKIGILAATLCTIAYFIGMSGELGALALIVDVGVYVWIAQLFIVTLAVGYVRDTLTQTRADAGEEAQFLQERLEDISSINESNVKIKDFFENRMVDSNESMGYIYKIISTLDTAKHSSVLFEATKIITTMMGTHDVAIYRVLPNGFLRLVTSTSERARHLGKSVHRDEIPSLISQIETKKLYINRKMDPALPSQAGALSNADGSIGFVVTLWDVDYEHMTLYNTNMLRVICELISNAVIRAADYLEVAQHSRVVEGTDIMNVAAFEELRDVFAQAKQENLADYCLIEVATDGRSIRQMADILKGSLRSTDIVGQIDANRLNILLNNTSLQDAMVVIRRLNSLGLRLNVLS